MHDALVSSGDPKKLTMKDVAMMVEKLSPNDAATVYNAFKLVNDLLAHCEHRSYIRQVK